MDLKKAFDAVDRAILSKLIKTIMESGVLDSGSLFI